MDDLHDRYEKELKIGEARRTISLALVRVLPFEVLLRRLENILVDDSPSEVVFAIGEAANNEHRAISLSASIRALMTSADGLDAKKRRRIDGYIHLLLPYLPTQLALPLLSEYLGDPRKTRRAAGFRALKRCDIDAQLASYLVERFGETGDTQFLKFVLRNPIPLTLEAAQEMIVAFRAEGDEYWPVRVIEAQLRSNREVAIALGQSNPKSFIWACGRVGDAELTREVSRVFKAANDKIPLLGIVAWAFGKLGAITELQQLDADLKLLESELQT